MYPLSNETGDDMNTGGRISLKTGSKVRILMINGLVSTHDFIVGNPDAENKIERSDRKGYLTITDPVTNRSLKVHNRRILPTTVDGRAIVIESGGNYIAVCPNCGHADKIRAGADFANCPSCNIVNPLHWLGAKPVMTAETVETAEVTTQTEANTPKAEKAQRAARVVREPVVIDLAKIAATENCELYTKKNVRFDHARVDVQAHVLIFTGENPRKLCFNTYNGALGKKSTELPLNEFLTDSATSGKKAKPWFSVSDVEKTREKLVRDGYEKSGT